MSLIVSDRDSTWSDMSDYIVHFTKDYEGVKAFGNFLSILSGYRIEARSRFGIAKDRAPDLDSQKAVCFTEVPLTHAERVTARRSAYGFAFDKAAAVLRGANPILYAYQNQSLALNMRQMMNLAIDKGDTDDPIFKITPFVDVPGVYFGSTYLFEWEREWRKLGDYHFSAEEISFIILPEERHNKARRVFLAQKKSTRHSHLHRIPIIDIGWGRKKIRSILKNV